MQAPSAPIPTPAPKAQVAPPPSEPSPSVDLADQMDALLDDLEQASEQMSASLDGAGSDAKADGLPPQPEFGGDESPSKRSELEPVPADSPTPSPQSSSSVDTDVNRSDVSVAHAAAAAKNPEAMSDINALDDQLARLTDQLLEDEAAVAELSKAVQPAVIETPEITPDKAALSTSERKSGSASSSSPALVVAVSTEPPAEEPKAPAPPSPVAASAAANTPNQESPPSSPHSSSSAPIAPPSNPSRSSRDLAATCAKLAGPVVNTVAGWSAAPIKSRPESQRQALGWIASWTGFASFALWGAILLRGNPAETAAAGSFDFVHGEIGPITVIEDHSSAGGDSKGGEHGAEAAKSGHGDAKAPPSGKKSKAPPKATAKPPAKKAAKKADAHGDKGGH